MQAIVRDIDWIIGISSNRGAQVVQMVKAGISLKIIREGLVQLATKPDSQVLIFSSLRSFVDQMTSVFKADSSPMAKQQNDQCWFCFLYSFKAILIWVEVKF